MPATKKISKSIKSTITFTSIVTKQRVRIRSVNHQLSFIQSTKNIFGFYSRIFFEQSTNVVKRMSIKIEDTLQLSNTLQKYTSITNILVQHALSIASTFNVIRLIPLKILSNTLTLISNTIGRPNYKAHDIINLTHSNNSSITSTDNEFNGLFVYDSVDNFIVKTRNLQDNLIFKNLVIGSILHNIQINSNLILQANVNKMIIIHRDLDDILSFEHRINKDIDYKVYHTFSFFHNLTLNITRGIIHNINLQQQFNTIKIINRTLNQIIQLTDNNSVNRIMQHRIALQDSIIVRIIRYRELITNLIFLGNYNLDFKIYGFNNQIYFKDSVSINNNVYNLTLTHTLTFTHSTQHHGRCINYMKRNTISSLHPWGAVK